MGDVAIPHAPLKPLGALKPLIHSFHSLPTLLPAVSISSILGAGCVNRDSSDAGRDIAAYMRAVPRLAFASLVTTLSAGPRRALACAWDA